MSKQDNRRIRRTSDNSDIEQTNITEETVDRSNIHQNTSKKKQKRIKITAFATAGVLAVVGIGYVLHKNKEPKVNVSASSVIESVSGESSIDEIIELYGTELSMYTDDKSIDPEVKVGALFKNKSEMISMLDTIEECIAVSNELEKLELDKITSARGGLRELTAAEKKAISDLPLDELKGGIDFFKNIDNVDPSDFTREAIEYNRIAMDLEYAEDLINSQIINDGNEILRVYGNLIIQSIIIDETGLDVEDYKDISIKNNGKNFEIQYEAESTGQLFTVEIKPSNVKKVLSYSEYFEKTADQIENGSFKNYKKEVLKAINTYKVSILGDYELNNPSKTNSSWVLNKINSNKEIEDKIKQLSK